MDKIIRLYRHFYIGIASSIWNKTMHVRWSFSIMAQSDHTRAFNSIGTTSYKLRASRMAARHTQFCSGSQDSSSKSTQTCQLPRFFTCKILLMLFTVLFISFAFRTGKNQSLQKLCNQALVWSSPHTGHCNTGVLWINFCLSTINEKLLCDLKQD